MCIVFGHIVQTQSLVHYLVHIVQTPKNYLEKNSANPPEGTQQTTINSGRNAQNQQPWTSTDNSQRLPTTSYADITSGKSCRKANKKEISLMTTDAIPLIFKSGSFMHSVFYFISKAQLHLQSKPHPNLRLLFPSKVSLGLHITKGAQGI
ncbi:hypothetical protein G6F37_001108 [Rhizopus arrhizus]|nr:hypothetical protein G6F38_001373 [Rhizopus arrhizus]KAG1163549.1 hypothetical protein G6F37_001108 [Rhizopus arrhizus]